MQTFAQKPKATQHIPSAKATKPGHAHLGQHRASSSTSHLQRTIGNQAVPRVPRTPIEATLAGLADMGSPPFGHDFSRIPIHPRAAGALQAKLSINEPGDEYEREADQVSEQVMRMEAPDIAHTAPPVIQRLGAGTHRKPIPAPLQRVCTECEEEKVHRQAAPPVAGIDGAPAPRQAEAKVDAVSGGTPLTSKQRTFFEPRFGADFSRVRIHTNRSADTAARAVGAFAFTRGNDVVFRGDQYRPHSYAGQKLLAHELTHVVQQGAAPRIRSRSGNGARPIPGSGLHMRMAYPAVQRFPGDGMTPPGDCGWGKYLILRGSVETAKAVVSTLGACSAGDSCLFLAAKIAAITAEIAARVALDTTCFRGGDSGHRQQVQDKVNMMNRCYRFFNASNCSPELIAAMAVVVARAREVIAVGAAAVAIAAVVALVVAIIALAKAIAALAAGAASATAIAGAAAAVIALLVLIKDEIAPDDSGA